MSTPKKQIAMMKESRVFIDSLTHEDREKFELLEEKKEYVYYFFLLFQQFEIRKLSSSGNRDKLSEKERKRFDEMVASLDDPSKVRSSIRHFNLILSHNISLKKCDGCGLKFPSKNFQGNACIDFCNRTFCSTCAPSFLRTKACEFCHRWICNKCVREMERCEECNRIACQKCIEDSRMDNCGSCLTPICEECAKETGHSCSSDTYCEKCSKNPTIEKSCNWK